MSLISYVIGKNLRTFREARGLSQKALADLVKVSRQTVVNYESGASGLDSKTIASFATALSVSELELIKDMPLPRTKSVIEAWEIVTQTLVGYALPRPAQSAVEISLKAQVDKWFELDRTIGIDKSRVMRILTDLMTGKPEKQAPALDALEEVLQDDRTNLDESKAELRDKVTSLETELRLFREKESQLKAFREQGIQERSHRRTLQKASKEETSELEALLGTYPPTSSEIRAIQSYYRALRKLSDPAPPMHSQAPKSSAPGRAGTPPNPPGAVTPLPEKERMIAELVPLLSSLDEQEIGGLLEIAKTPRRAPSLEASQKKRKAQD